MRISVAAIRVGLGLSAAILSFAAVAHASVLLVPGGHVGVPGTSYVLEPSLAIVHIEEEEIVPLACFTPGGAFAFKAQVHYSVNRRSDGSLDFYYLVLNDANSPSSIEFVDTTDFSVPTKVYVDWRTDGLGTVQPLAASRSGDGTTIEWDFAKNPIKPGASSRFFFVHSEWQNYDDKGTITLYGGGASCTLSGTYRPI